MKKRTLALLLAACIAAGMLTACGGNTTSSVPAEQSAPAAETAASTEEAPTPEPVVSVQEEASVASEVEPVSVVEESAEPEAPKTCTVTFSDGQTFEATVGEPQNGEEGAGITTSDGTVTYSNVGLGGPYSYPTSEKVTISGFTGDFEITITDAATYMDATYTIYTDEQDIADAIAFAEEMAKQQAANPMP